MCKIYSTVVVYESIYFHKIFAPQELKGQTVPTAFDLNKLATDCQPGVISACLQFWTSPSFTVHKQAKKNIKQKVLLNHIKFSSLRE